MWLVQPICVIIYAFLNSKIIEETTIQNCIENKQASARICTSSTNIKNKNKNKAEMQIFKTTEKMKIVEKD